MASEFITRVEHGKDEPYTVIFRTDDADKYKHIEDECRRMIGHEKPTVDAVPVEQIESFIDWLERNGYTLLKKAIINALHNYRTDGERRPDGEDNL